MRRGAGGVGIAALMILVVLVRPGTAVPQGAAGRAAGRQDAASRAAERVPPAVAASIAQRVTELMRRRGYPGFSVGVVFENELIYSQSFGVSDRETKRPAGAETLYQIGSVTKVFTATLLVALRDKGVVRLDDPLTEYLPAGVALPTDGRGAPVITLRHLATHASGLPPDVVNPGRAKDGDPWKGYSAGSLYAGLAETRLEFPTGARWGYSNLGYGLLGMALERAAGKPYEALLREHVFDPLKMGHSTVTLSDAHRGLLATPYRDDDPTVKTEPWDLGVLSPAGGIASSVAELSKFLSLQFRAGEAGVTPIVGSSLLEMQTPQRFIAEWRSANGLGWRIDRSDEIGNVVSHGGDVDGYASYVGFSPAHRIGVIVLTNSGIGRPVGELGGWLMNLAVRSVRPSLSKPPSPEEAQAYHQRADWERAAWAYGALTLRDPSDGFALSRLGLALTHLRRYEQAADAYRRALRLKFRPPQTMYNLACVYSLKGDRDEAVRWLERALSAGFENREALETDPDLHNLRQDPRFRRLLRQRR